MQAAAPQLLAEAQTCRLLRWLPQRPLTFTPQPRGPGPHLLPLHAGEKAHSSQWSRRAEKQSAPGRVPGQLTGPVQSPLPATVTMLGRPPGVPSLQGTGHWTRPCRPLRRLLPTALAQGSLSPSAGGHPELRATAGPDRCLEPQRGRRGTDSGQDQAGGGRWLLPTEAPDCLQALNNKAPIPTTLQITF